MLTLAAFALIALSIQSRSPAAFRHQLEQSLPSLIDPSVLEDIGPCGFIPDAPTLRDYRSISSPLTVGQPAAPVHLLVFFDPFCPLCRVLDKNLEEVQRSVGPALRIVAIPVSNLEGSEDAVRLIHAAAQLNHEDLPPTRVAEKLFALQDSSPAPLPRRHLASALNKAGLPVDALLPLLDSPDVTRNLKEGHEAFEAAGATVTPYILINGRPLKPSASSVRPGCLTRIIAESRNGATDSPQTSPH